MTDADKTPLVLRSLRALDKAAAPQLPIQRLGTTYTMAQAVSWVDFEHFAVGRWDGTLSIFNMTSSVTQGALITTAFSPPSDQGVQMVEWIAQNTFITSNDESSMIVWQSTDSTFETVDNIQTLSYASSYGVANSATAQNIGDTLYVVTGHEAGYLLIWQGALDGTGLSFVKAVDLTSATPVNPWNLQNIRGVSWFMSDSTSIKVVTGSENGEICVVDVPSGNVLSRTVFNPNAQRGINAVSVAGQNLLVANCSVGSSDKNLWYYWIDGNTWSVTLRSSINLIVDTSRTQVFNFDVTWAFANNNIVFFSATEEGVLWMGTIVNNSTISMTGYESVAVADLGAALAAGVGNLAYVAYNVSSFDTDPSNKGKAGSNPNRIDQMLG